MPRRIVLALLAAACARAPAPETAMPDAAAAPRPPIDARAPARHETATFALG